MTAARLVGSFEPGSAPWHAARAGGIGASEIAAVLDLSPWESRFSLWLRKAGMVGPAGDEEWLRWGRVLEEPVARRFAQEHPELRVARTGTWASTARGWQLANPDRLTRPRGGGTVAPLECKWSPYGDGWGPSGTDEIPVYYRTQVLQQLDVLGADVGYLAALVGAEYREYRIEFDLDDVHLMRAAGAAFMASVHAGDRPDIDATAHTYRALKQLHPDIDDREQEIPADLAGRYRAGTAALAVAERDAQLVRNELLDAMGTARHAVCDGERIALRKPHGRGGVALVETKPPKPAGQRVRGAA